jgi:uncharacterized RDD family membrane protein YckC
VTSTNNPAGSTEEPHIARDAWAFEALLICFLLIAPAFALGVRHSGLSTFSIELHQYWIAHFPPLTFFLIAPSAALLMTIDLLMFPDRPTISRPVLLICLCIAVVAVTHEVRMRVSPLSEGLVSTLLVARYNSLGLFFSTVLAVRNWRKPTLENAFGFHAVFLAWLFIVAFPWPRQVWDLPN